MKKLLCVFAAFVIASSMVACGNKTLKENQSVSSDSSSAPASSSTPSLSSAPTSSSEATSSSESSFPQENLNPLTTAEVKTADVMNGFKTERIGTRAYIEVSKDVLKTVTLEQYTEFVDTVVKDKDYNWFSIICEDGTGITFPGSMGIVADYGAQDKDGTIIKSSGTIMLTDSGYAYTPIE